MSRTSKRRNTKGVKRTRRISSGMRDHDAERREKLMKRQKTGRGA